MTMYHSKLVASIKSNGKILREFKDTVYLNFGSEYTIYLKNLNTVRALINVYIDGENVTPSGLVLNAGQQIDFERSLANGSLTEGNRFKFIERTGKIEDHRGIKAEDGLINIEYQFEKVYKRQAGIQWIPTVAPNEPWKYPYNSGITWTSDNNAILRSSGIIHDSYQQSDVAHMNNIMAVGATLSASSAAPQTETGITVAGSKSEQKFTTVSSFTCEPEKHNIILKLLGETEDNKAIREPITVKHKQKCNICGHTNKATSKYCGECGTALVIYA